MSDRKILFCLLCRLIRRRDVACFAIGSGERRIGFPGRIASGERLSEIEDRERTIMLTERALATAEGVQRIVVTMK